MTKAAQESKADLGKRFIAAIIDAVIAYAVSLIPLIGGLVGTAYILLRDGLDYEFMDKRSIGKKILKLRIVSTDEEEIDIQKSIKRNWMFAAVILLSTLVTPILIISIVGLALIPLIMILCLAAVVFEIVMIITKPDGRRWGDEFAGTRVIEVED